MAEVNSQPVPIAEPNISSQSFDKDALVTRLDQLLEKYLNTLDEYQKAREQLSKQLSSGYFSLAEANFQNRSTAVRYGQDCYDDRMQAIRKVNVKDVNLNSDNGHAATLAFTMEPSSQGIRGRDDNSSTSHEKPPDVPNSEAKSHRDPSDANEQDKQAQKLVDPLRWFGILVPPALRSAQSTFVAVVEGSIPRLASLGRDLRNQEIEIGRVKKQMKKM